MDLQVLANYMQKTGRGINIIQYSICAPAARRNINEFQSSISNFKPSKNIAHPLLGGQTVSWAGVVKKKKSSAYSSLLSVRPPQKSLGWVGKIRMGWSPPSSCLCPALPSKHLTCPRLQKALPHFSLPLLVSSCFFWWSICYYTRLCPPYLPADVRPEVFMGDVNRCNMEQTTQKKAKRVRHNPAPPKKQALASKENNAERPKCQKCTGL